MTFTKRIAAIVGLLTLGATVLTLIGAVFMGQRVQSALREGADAELELTEQLSDIGRTQLQGALLFDRSLWFGEGLTDKDRKKYLAEALADFDDLAGTGRKQITEAVSYSKKRAAAASDNDSGQKTWMVFATRLEAIQKEQNEYQNLVRQGFELLRSGQVMEAQRLGVGAQQGHERIHGQLLQLRDEVSKVRIYFDSRLNTAELYGQLFAVVLAVLGAAMATATGLVLSRNASSAIQELVDGMLGSIQTISETANQTLVKTKEADAMANTAAQALAQIKGEAAASGERARKVSSEAESGQEAARSGERTVETAVESLRTVRQQIEAMAVSVLKLRERSRPIGDLIEAAGEVADLSKVLALNSAIQSAKDGRTDDRLTAVASEARSVAKQSGETADNIRKILGEMQKAANVAVMVTEQGSRAVEAVVDQSIDANETVRAAIRSIVDPAPTANQIAASCDKQVADAQKAAAAVETLKSASAQGLEGMRRIEQGTQNLGVLSHRLRLLLGSSNGTRNAA